jgi:hypothetical protein
MELHLPSYDLLSTTSRNQLSQDYIALRVGSNGTGNAISASFDAAVIRAGASSSSKHRSLFIPYGVKGKDHRDEIRSVINAQLDLLKLKFFDMDSSISFILHDNVIIGYMKIAIYSTYIDVNVRAFDNLATIIIDKLEAEFMKNPPPTVERVVISPHDKSLRSDDVTLPTTEFKGDIHLLYPHFDQTPAELWKSFEESNSNVMLLIGPPGLGKSSFIRAMLDARGWGEHKTFIAERTDVLLHPGLSDFIRSTPRKSVFVTEDSDVIVAKRDDGNSNMAGLLNTASGIIPTDTKIIISTNLPNLRRVDEALLRPGRMFRVLEFKPLTIEHGHAIRDTMQLPPVDFGNMTELTLAEVINWHDINGTINKATRIGYT